MNSVAHLPKNIKTLSSIAEAATLLGLALIASFLAYAIYLLIDGNIAADAYLQQRLLPAHPDAPLSVGQRWVAALLIGAAEVLSVYALWTARGLFGSFRRGNIFTLSNAARLRLIGWLLALSAPLGIATTSLGSVILSAWRNTGSVALSVGIEKNQITILLLGLLFVVVGHVLYQAMLVAEENKAFI